MFRYTRKAVVSVTLGTALIFGSTSPASAQSSFPQLPPPPADAVRIATTVVGVLGVIGVLASVTGNSGSGAVDAGTGWGDLDLQRERLAEEINATRAADGQKPVTWKSDFDDPAIDWAEALAREGVLRHAHEGYDGEIIVMVHGLDGTTAKRMVKAWNNSSGHHEIMHGTEFDALTLGIAVNPVTDQVFGVGRFHRPGSEDVAEPAVPTEQSGPTD